MSAAERARTAARRRLGRSVRGRTLLAKADASEVGGHPAAVEHWERSLRRQALYSRSRVGAVVLLLWVAMIVLPGRSNAPTRAASATTRRRWRAAPVAAHVPALTPRALAPATATIRTHELRRSVCCP